MLTAFWLILGPCVLLLYLMKDLYNFLTLIYKDDTEKKVEAENEDELQDTRNMDLLTKLNTRIGLEELCALSDCI